VIVLRNAMPEVVVKLLRTIRLDPSDSLIFEESAEPGEWAVSGAFAFANRDPANFRGKARTAFRAGFLGLESLGRSTLAQIVEASEKDRRAAVEVLAVQLVECFGAPDLATARQAAEEEISFAASLCDHSPGVLVAVTRSYETERSAKHSARCVDATQLRTPVLSNVWKWLATMMTCRRSISI
jgi:Family of unknown function (DUF6505)